MKPLEIGPEMYLYVELEMNFPCSTVVEAAAGLALLTDCGKKLATVDWWWTINGQWYNGSFWSQGCECSVGVVCRF